MDRLRLLVLSLLFGAAPPAAFAEVPRVQFDLPYSIACHDVSPPGFLAANPGLKLIEVRLEISSLLVAGQEKDLTQYFIRIESPQQSLHVVDYLPKTLQECSLTTPVHVSTAKAKNT